MTAKTEAASDLREPRNERLEVREFRKNKKFASESDHAPMIFLLFFRVTHVKLQRIFLRVREDEKTASASPFQSNAKHRRDHVAIFDNCCKLIN